MRYFKLLIISAIAFAPTLAFAHQGEPTTHDVVRGFMHPLSGLDHLLAMIAVGIFAAQLGGRALWLVPLSFVATMAVAGALGMAGIAVPFVETGIALSVIVLGAAIAFRLEIPVTAAAVLVALFAVFHGHAHGTETPSTDSGLAYGAGFVAATALLHAIGVGIGLLIGRAGLAYSPRIMQAGGTAVAAAGLAILAHIV